MSKKDKSKFRRRVKEQLLKEMAQTKAKPQQRPDLIFNKPAKEPGHKKEAIPAQEQIISEPQEAKTQEENDFSTYIKRDLKKSAIIIGLMTLLLFTVWFVDLKTGFLITSAEKVFVLLNINI